MIEEDKSAQSQPLAAQTSLATSGSEPSAAKWTLGHNGHNVDIVFEGETGVASVYGLPSNTRVNDPDLAHPIWAKALARGHLIAAAPDLYEALKEAVAALEVTLTWPEGWECSEDDLLGRARAALARADSRQ